MPRFPKGNRDLCLAAAVEPVFTHEAYCTLFPPHGNPAQPTRRLAIATLHHAEGLSIAV